MTHTKSNIVQYNEYYPFGLQTANSWTRENATGNNFLANGGTEFNATSNLYDLDYRNYDPVLGRMNGVDPMATKYASLTPYNYSFNDPVSFTDPSGADPAADGYSPIYEQYTSWMYSPTYGRLQDDVIYGRLIGWKDMRPGFLVGQDWMFRGAGQGITGSGSWQASTFAGISLPYIALLRADAQAVKSGQMSLDDYAARHGNSPTQNDIQYLANALGLDVMGMDGNNAWLQVNLIKAVYAGGLDAGNQIAMGTYGVINVALGVGRKDLLNALSKTNSSQTQGSGPGSQSDFIYDNNNAIGLGIGILEPGFGAAWDAVRAAPGAYTNGAKIISKVGGVGLVGANVALTTYTLVNEYQNGSFNTHSIVNGAVTVVGVGLTITGLVVSAPVVAIVGAGIGIGYGIAQVAGIDGWIDSNWGFNNKTPK